MEKLKLCPFCGGEAILKIVAPHKHKMLSALGIDFPDCEGSCFVECLRCSCALAEGTKEEAIEAWNTRHEPPTLGGIIVPAGNARFKK